MSVHGAALAHSPFLSHPSALFELFNAGEDYCYRYKQWEEGIPTVSLFRFARPSLFSCSVCTLIICLAWHNVPKLMCWCVARAPNVSQLMEGCSVSARENANSPFSLPPRLVCYTQTNHTHTKRASLFSSGSAIVTHTHTLSDYPICYRTLAARFGIRYHTLDRMHVKVTYQRLDGDKRGWVTPKEANYSVDIGQVVKTAQQLFLELEGARDELWNI